MLAGVFRPKSGLLREVRLRGPSQSTFPLWARSLAALTLGLWLATPAAADTCLVTVPIGPGNDLGTAVAVQPDGKILLAGYASVARTTLSC